ncbi:MAG: hypothetical protein ACOCPR_01430 [Guyparkeria sp.]
MPRKSSHQPLLLAAALLVGFMLLSVALDGFELRRGLRLETGVADTLDRVVELRDRETRTYYNGRVIGWVVSVVVGASIVVFFVALARRENRVSTLFLVVIGMGAALLITRIPPPRQELETELEEGENGAFGGDGAIPLIEEMDEEDAADVEPEPSSGSSVVSWILAGAAAVAIVLVVRPRIGWRRADREGDDESGRDEGKSPKGADDSDDTASGDEGKGGGKKRRPRRRRRKPKGDGGADRNDGQSGGESGEKGSRKGDDPASTPSD